MITRRSVACATLGLQVTEGRFTKIMKQGIQFQEDLNKSQVSLGHSIIFEQHYIKRYCLKATVTSLLQLGLHISLTKFIKFQQAIWGRKARPNLRCLFDTSKSCCCSKIKLPQKNSLYRQKANKVLLIVRNSVNTVVDPFHLGPKFKASSALTWSGTVVIC